MIGAPDPAVQKNGAAQEDPAVQDSRHTGGKAAGGAQETQRGA